MGRWESRVGLLKTSPFNVHQSSRSKNIKCVILSDYRKEIQFHYIIEINFSKKKMTELHNQFDNFADDYVRIENENVRLKIYVLISFTIFKDAITFLIEIM